MRISFLPVCVSLLFTISCGVKFHGKNDSKSSNSSETNGSKEKNQSPNSQNATSEGCGSIQVSQNDKSSGGNGSWGTGSGGDRNPLAYFRANVTAGDKVMILGLLSRWH